MPALFGSMGWGWLVIVAIAAVALAAAAFLLRKTARRPGRTRARREPQQGRLVVLESTPVDEARRLVLVRCDEVEHLILTGGPADLVVDNDVRRQGAGAHVHDGRAAKAERRPPQAWEEEGAAPAQPQRAIAAVEAERRAAPPAAERSQPAAASRKAVRPAPPRAEPEETVAEDEPRPARNGAAPAEWPVGGRGRAEPAAPPLLRAEATPRPAPLAETPSERAPAAERKAVRETAPRPREAARAALPSANVPWSGDDMEGEIVRAIRVEPAAPVVARQQPRTAAAESPVTLGDLAERLEEALAREVRDAGRREEPRDFDVQEFEFEAHEIEPEIAPVAPVESKPEPRPRAEPRERADPRDRASPKDRVERRERVEPRERLEQRRAGASEPERRAPPERAEEAPVISLSSRRREPVDPLEDEMARLLGELTGDQNRR
jgi:hypothetical protein